MKLPKKIDSSSKLWFLMKDLFIENYTQADIIIGELGEDTHIVVETNGDTWEFIILSALWEYLIKRADFYKAYDVFNGNKVMIEARVIVMLYDAFKKGLRSAKYNGVDVNISNDNIKLTSSKDIIDEINKKGVTEFVNELHCSIGENNKKLFQDNADNESIKTFDEKAKYWFDLYKLEKYTREDCIKEIKKLEKLDEFEKCHALNLFMKKL